MPRVTEQTHKIDFFLAADIGYLRGLVVAVGSTLANLSPTYAANFHIYWEGRTAIPRFFLSKLQHIKNAQIHFHEWDMPSSGRLPTGHHFKEINYKRITAPRKLRGHISSLLIYLDCDLLVRADLGSLLSAVRSSDILAAVAEPDFYWHAKVGLPRNYRYFNSGLMCINVDRYLQEAIDESAMKIAVAQPSRIMMVDQDALNIVVAERWSPIGAVWNYMGLDDRELITSKVIHFSSPDKPWRFGGGDARTKLFTQCERDILPPGVHVVYRLMTACIELIAVIVRSMSRFRKRFLAVPKLTEIN